MINQMFLSLSITGKCDLEINQNQNTKDIEPVIVYLLSALEKLLFPSAFDHIALIMHL